MKLRAPAFRHLPVGDVAHEDVAEGVLLVIRDCRLLQMRDEVAALELGQARPRILWRGSLACAEVCDRAGPEDRADHRGVVGELLLLRVEAVEARADQPLHGRWNRHVEHLVALVT